MKMPGPKPTQPQGQRTDPPAAGDAIVRTAASVSMDVAGPVGADPSLTEDLLAEFVPGLRGAAKPIASGSPGVRDYGGFGWTPPRPGPITRLKNEVLDHLISDDWVGFCRFVKNQDQHEIKALQKKMWEVRNEPPLGNQLSNNDLYWHLWFAQQSPVVEYVVEKELADAVALSSLPDSSISIGEAFRAPYPVVAIRISGEPRSAYMLYGAHDGDLLVGHGHFSKAPLADSIGSIYPTIGDHASLAEFRKQLGILAYLVHGKDVCEDALEHRGSAKKARNKAELDAIRGTVGGLFVTALKAWSKTVAGGGDGTHASPKPHCRGGHWHLYWTGKGRTTPKMNFVHPCLVNADAVGDASIQRTLKSPN